MLAGLAIMFAILSFDSGEKNFQLAPTVIGFGSACFLMGAELFPIRASAVVKVLTAPLSFAGRASYELYIFHTMVFLFVNPYVLNAVRQAGLDYTTSVQRWILLGLITVLIPLALALNTFVTEPLNRKIRGFYLAPRRHPLPDVPSDKESDDVSVSGTATEPPASSVAQEAPAPAVSS
jgi:peptidoglycan/LPS O-acetylase OafA/YrhL